MLEKQDVSNEDIAQWYEESMRFRAMMYAFLNFSISYDIFIKYYTTSDFFKNLCDITFNTTYPRYFKTLKEMIEE